MSTQKDQQKMEKIIQEATLRYPDVAHHRVSAKKLFSKILDIQFYATDGITNAELQALSGTLMYFSVDEEQKHFIYQNLLAMLHSDDHHEQVLACGLINKISQAKWDKEKLPIYDKSLSDPVTAFTPGAMTGIAIERWHTENELAIKFPWALSREEIKKLIQGDKDMLTIIKYLGYSGATIGGVSGLISHIIKIAMGRATPWIFVIIGLTIAAIVINHVDGKSEESLEKEGARRGMSDLCD